MWTYRWTDYRSYYYLLNSSTAYDLGTGTSINVSNIYDKYTTLTTDNFMVCIEKINLSLYVEGEGHSNASNSNQISISKSYNASTGILTISGTGINVSASHYSGNCYGSSSASISIRTYLIIK